MVKSTVCFICEGASEVALIESEQIKNYIPDFRIDYRDAGGCSSILKVAKRAINQNIADFYIVLTDLDNRPCVKQYADNLLQNINDSRCTIVLAIREIEAWLLADSVVTQKVLGITYNDVENLSNPSDILKNQYNSLYPKNTISTSHKRMMDEFLKSSFSLQESAKNSPSAKRFLEKLEKLNFS